VPRWAEVLDAQCFGQAWGPLDDGEHLWAASPLAFARWKVTPSIGEAELLRLAVDPQARREGLGGSLLAHSEKCLRRMGVDTLFLEVRVSNRPAVNLYRGQGWTFQGIRKAYYRDGEDAALYRKEIR
jgi:ribosomal-protein-alanine N-acetyltransferase